MDLATDVRYDALSGQSPESRTHEALLGILFSNDSPPDFLEIVAQANGDEQLEEPVHIRPIDSLGHIRGSPSLNLPNRLLVAPLGI